MKHKWFRRSSSRGGRRFGTWFVAGVSLLAVSLLIYPQVLGASEPDQGEPAAEEMSGPGGGEEFPHPPPPLSDYFPCSMCHEDMETNPVRRELEEEHEDIVLKHDEEHRWCLDCHDADNRDMLRSASGELIPFEESYRLCGQCHGPKLRDWRAGVHGKRTGNWRGDKQYLLCVHCHDQHAPKFKPMVPMPPPVRPENLRKQPELTGNPAEPADDH